MRRFALLTLVFTALILGLATVHVRAADPEPATATIQCPSGNFVVPWRRDGAYQCPMTSVTLAGGGQAQPLPGVVEQAIADQANRTCRGFCGPTIYARPGDCRYDFSCAPSAPAPAAARPSLAAVAPAQNPVSVVAGVRILAPNTGDGGLLR